MAVVKKYFLSTLWTQDGKVINCGSNENLVNGSPVTFGIPGHAIVVDGYDSAKDMFHLNYGGGPDAAGTSEENAEQSYTRWYTREEFRQLGGGGI